MNVFNLPSPLEFSPYTSHMKKLSCREVKHRAAKRRVFGEQESTLILSPKESSERHWEGGRAEKESLLYERSH